MTARAVARRYAAALFDVASAGQRLDVVGKSMASFNELVHSSPDLVRVFENPAVPAVKKRAVIDALLEKSGDLAVEVRRLLGMLADRDRLALIPEIAKAFAERQMTADRVVSADVITAAPLADGRAEALTQALSRATGQRVTMTTRVDPSIIGGVIARVGSLVFDGSVRRQLQRMRETLVADA